jgi:hypothetical protein
LELAATLVVDFDGHTLRLAHRKGRPAKLRWRYVALSAEAIEFFKEQSKDKLPGVSLFTEDRETPWRRHVWAKEVRAAIANHNRDASAKRRISTHATAYGLRHARISELLQIFAMQEKLAALKDRLA